MHNTLYILNLLLFLQASLKTIQLLRQSCNGCSSYGITQFSDLSPEEFAKLHLTPISTRLPRMGTFHMAKSKRSITTAVVSSIDW